MILQVGDLDLINTIGSLKIGSSRILLRGRNLIDIKIVILTDILQVCINSPIQLVTISFVVQFDREVLNVERIIELEFTSKREFIVDSSPALRQERYLVGMFLADIILR